MHVMNRAGFLIAGLALSAGDAVAAAVVAARSPVSTLGKNQVVPIDQAEGSAARDEFCLKFSGKSAAQLKANWSKIIFTGRGRPLQEVSNSIEVKICNAEAPNTIGYIDQSPVDGSVKVLLAQ